MTSDSYKDLKRYLQVAGKLGLVEERYLGLKNSAITIIPHDKPSLFSDQIPVNADVLKQVSGAAAFYCVSHANGVIYIQKLEYLKKFLGSEITDGNYLTPISEWIDIKSSIVNPWANKTIYLHAHSEYCLDGDTLIYNCVKHAGSNGKVYRKDYTRKKRSIKDLYKDWKRMGRGLRFMVKVWDGENFVPSRIRNIVKSPKKFLYELKTESGKTIRCSEEHKFLTKDGWKRLCELTKKDLMACNIVQPFAVCYEQVAGITPVGEKTTYDLEVDHPAHNFIANGFVTHNSALDGLAKPIDIARRCKQLDMPSMGITDHGTLSGIIDFYKACKKFGIKPVIGQEFYLDDDRTQKGAPEDVKKAMKGDKEGMKLWLKQNRINLRRHLCLFAKNEVGLSNLYKLSSLAYLEGFYYRPRIDWELLAKHSEGLICGSACASGVICGEDTTDMRVRNFKRLFKIFGRDNLYLEVMLIEYEKQPGLNDFIFALAKKANVQVIVGTDSHYVDPDPDHIHQLYMQAGANYSYGEGNNYLMSWLELKRMYEKYFRRCTYGWDHYDRALASNFDLASKCNVEIELGKFKMPSFDLETAVVPAVKGETRTQYLIRRAKDGFKELVMAKIAKDKIPTYVERLKHELRIFLEAGYVNYMLIVLDMIDYAKSIDRLVVVRGSAAGSLLCYCLRMTTVDPIKNDLLFERFVSPLRAGLVDKSYQSPPDIDVDYPDRDEMIEYAASKYGKDCVARIGTCNRNQLRQAIKNMASVTSYLDFPAANKVTKMIPDSCKDVQDAIDNSTNFGDWYDEKANKAWIDKYVEPVLGIVGHHSIHAAGIVIAPGPIAEYLPVKVQEKKKEDEKSQEKVRHIITQFEGSSVEEIGLLKFDVLRVRTLAHLKRTQILVRERHKRDIDFPKLDLDNPKFYAGFKKKDTQGVFQMDTVATSQLLNHTTVENFPDVTAVISLSRPGTAGPGLDMEYCARKKGKPFEYDHPMLEPILKDTLGVCCVAKGTKVWVPSLGRYQLIEDMTARDCQGYPISKRGIHVSKKSKFVQAKLTRRRAECLSIKTVTHNELIATPDHLILESGGTYAFAKNCKVGKNIPLAIPIAKTNWASQEQILTAKWIGYLLANGQIAGGQWNFTSKNRDIISAFVEVVDALFGDTVAVVLRRQIRDVIRVSVKGTESRKNPTNSVLVKYGLLSKGSYGAIGKTKSSKKFIPEQIKAFGFDARLEMAKAMYECDGTKAMAVYSTISQQLACDYKELLASIGILAVVKIGKEISRVYILNVEAFCELTGYEMSGAYIERFEFNHQHWIRLYCDDYGISQNEFGRRFDIPHIKNMMRQKRLLRRSVERLVQPFPSLRGFLSKDIWWDRIVSVNKKIRDAYDVFGSKTMNFTANDVIVHNCFQEQLMQMVNQLGGMTLVEADKFRKMMKKKDMSQMGTYREKFVAGAIERGVGSRKEALAIWEKIISWSRYGFAKAHAAAYAQLSVWTMIMKQYFPIEFYVGWLENPKNKDQLVRIYKDMRRHNIPIIFPDVNRSKAGFSISDKNEIIWSLKGIKFVGPAVVKEIADNAPYSSMRQFVDKLKGKKVTKRAIDPLIYINAFPWNLTPRESAIEYYTSIRNEAVPPQFNIQDDKYWNKKFHEFTGFYREDPLDTYADQLKRWGKLDTVDEYKALTEDEGVKMAGYVIDYRFIMSKRGPMAVMTIEVEMEPMNVVCWNSFYERSCLAGLDKTEIIGKFAFVFGVKGTDNRGQAQIQIGNPNEEILKLYD